MPRPAPPPPLPEYTVGLDLGQAQDFTALAILETKESKHSLRYLSRWELGTSYPKIVADVCELVQREPLVNPALVTDASGVGRAVIDLLRGAALCADLQPVTITAGSNISFVEGFHRVPKKELVSTLQVALQTKRLTIVKQLRYTELLVKELQNFRVKVTEAVNETFNARDGEHDDLVLALKKAMNSAPKRSEF